MSTRDTILAAALKVLEESGSGQFSTRAVCAIASVTAPTLYHHFGSADGLLSAAMAHAFQEILNSKHAAVQSTDPEMALREGWNDYVRFAAERPKLYSAMIGRLLDGAHIEAADQGNAALKSMVEAVAAEGRLAVSVEAASDLVWASANAVSLLYATAHTRKAPKPDAKVIEGMREAAIQVLLVPKTQHQASRVL
jgi:AcrR family transcriptional regulator